MDQIILQTNFKYLVAGLSTEQKGRLFDLLLEHAGEPDISAVAEKEEPAVGNIFRYIMLQQQESAAKRQRMRDIGAKGGAAKRQLALFGGKGDKNGGASLVASDASAAADDGKALPEQRLDKRKEAKENNKINLKNNIFDNGKNVSVRKDIPLTEQIVRAAGAKAFPQGSGFIPPTVAEVKAFTEAEALKVDAAVFVDFYTARGWCVGRTPIRSWQATARLWHHRAEEKEAQDAGSVLSVSSGYPQKDEDYWSAMETRVKNSEEKTAVPTAEKTAPIAVLSSTGNEHPLHRQDKLTPREDNISSRTRLHAPTAMTDGEFMPRSPFAGFIKRIAENDFTPAEPEATFADSNAGNRTANGGFTDADATDTKLLTGDNDE